MSHASHLLSAGSMNRDVLKYSVNASLEVRIIIPGIDPINNRISNIMP